MALCNQSFSGIFLKNFEPGVLLNHTNFKGSVWGLGGGGVRAKILGISMEVKWQK